MVRDTEHVWLWVFVKLIQVADQDILYGAVIKYLSFHGSAAGCLEPLGTILVMQPEDTPAAHYRFVL